MRIFTVGLLMVFLSRALVAEEVYLPQGFQEGQIIEQVILISDVDGVVRESVEATADPRIILAIQSLVKNKNVDVTFISGTPVDNDFTLEAWRRGNVPLNKVFGFSFEKELLEEQVTIYGVLGGHRMNGDGSLKVLDEYCLASSFELGSLLLHSFLQEVLDCGSLEQRALAKNLQIELNLLQFEDCTHLANATVQEFGQVVSSIRKHLDPNFRLISNGASVEIHVSNPPWSALVSSKWMQQAMEQPQYLVSHIPSWQRKMATGFAKKGDVGFNYLLISKTNKGLTTKKHIEEKLKKFPRALVITIGDTQVDFPMHENAHVAFHVGLEHVWRNNLLSQCFMIRDHEGKDSQHVEGTLKVLELLEDAIGKSFYDFKYFPKMDRLGKWDYYSVRELQKQGEK